MFCVKFVKFLTNVKILAKSPKKADAIYRVPTKFLRDICNYASVPTIYYLGYVIRYMYL